jgi:hypothetical protein
LIEQLINCIKQAEEQGAIAETRNHVLSGYSGSKLIGVLERLVQSYEQASYLEVGVYQGLTLLSVALSNENVKCYGIDNFAYFDPDGSNLELVMTRAEKLKLSNFEIINEDYEDALSNLSNHVALPIGVYFVDGPHDYRSQLMCLEIMKPFLHDRAVIVVDDSNYAHVRQANRDFLLVNPDFKLLFEAYTDCHPGNMPVDQNARARDGWWNGVNIMVRDPDNELDRRFPPTERDRILYENEHVIHASELAELAPEAVGAFSVLLSRRFYLFPIAVARFIGKYTAVMPQIKGRYVSMNTGSAGLTRFNLTPKKNEP